MEAGLQSVAFLTIFIIAKLTLILCVLISIERTCYSDITIGGRGLALDRITKLEEVAKIFSEF